MVIDGAHVQHTAGKTSTAKKRKSRIAAISVTLANCCQKEGSLQKALVYDTIPDAIPFFA